jgi:cathepsin L
LIVNAGSCGAGWAFAAAAATESANYLKGGRRLVPLSEQNLIDCSSGRPYGNSGCSGGSADTAFEYIINNRGVDTEASYPYQAALGVCRYNATNAGGSVVNYTQISSGDDNALLQAVAAQPVAVGFDASDPAFRWYSGGVYGGGACSTTHLNHAMAVVGWGVEVASTYHLTYWTVKNSWGAGWGERGFVRVARGSDSNTCGIATAASYPSA